MIYFIIAFIIILIIYVCVRTMYLESSGADSLVWDSKITTLPYKNMFIFS